MTALIPNSIENDTPADAAEVEQNFDAIQSYVNTNRDQPRRLRRDDQPVAAGR